MFIMHMDHVRVLETSPNALLSIHSFHLDKRRLTLKVGVHPNEIGIGFTVRDPQWVF